MNLSILAFAHRGDRGFRAVPSAPRRHRIRRRQSRTTRPQACVVHRSEAFVPVALPRRSWRAFRHRRRGSLFQANFGSWRHTGRAKEPSVNAQEPVARVIGVEK